jgi:hypothetical protein
VTSKSFRGGIAARATRSTLPPMIFWMSSSR